MDSKFTEEPPVIDVSLPIEVSDPVVEALTFDTDANRIVVHFSDAMIQTYGPEDIESYLRNYGRPEDIAAMGWDANGTP